uniref:G-protein coupled receptors family 2 profile 2 domain-containing protein n=1 Tax=Cynoglossus semilaevis TaxID=244447 RepID=A0A3P8VYJ5_CYNSE
MAGLLHFLVVASFVWMLLEACQLYLLVRRLSKVQVIQRDGLPRPLLYLLGYGVPFVIVGVSALIYSDGYGATEGGSCWLSQRRSFNWALTGPVVTVLGVSLWSRYSQPGVSNSNQPGTLLLPSFQLGSIQPPPPRYLNTNAVYCYCANSKYKYIFLFICILTICTMTKQKIFLFICILTSTIEKKINDKKKGCAFDFRKNIQTRDAKTPIWAY